MRIAVLSVILITIILSGCGKGLSNQLLERSTPTPHESPNARFVPKEYTLEQLKKYDGLNGNRAYVAVDGIVYDVTDSDLLKNAGKDISDLIGRTPELREILKKMPAVGALKK